MPFESEVLFAILFSFPAGAVIVWLIMRSIVSRSCQTGAAAIDRLEHQLMEYRVKERQLAEGCSRLEKDLAVEKEKNSLMVEIKDERLKFEKKAQDLEKELRTLTAGLAQEKERTANLMDLNKKLDLREKTIDVLNERLSNQKSIETELKTQLAQERRQAEEKLVLLDVLGDIILIGVTPANISKIFGEK